MRKLPVQLVIIFVVASSPAVASAQSPPCDGMIDGHVIDEISHEPVVGAVISIDGNVVEFTDEQGRFEVAGLCPERVTVEASRDDYAPSQRDLEVTGKTSIELELRTLATEVIVIEDDAPDAIDMRSTTEVSGDALDRTRGGSLAEALDEVPGVTKLGSGSGMAKPIVRGQFGRRLLLLVDGVRHRGQDWGLDHAPEIDPFVADRLIVVRGAAGVRYGPDAIGGAIVVEPPHLRHAPGIGGELHLIGFANGLGGSVAARVQATTPRLPQLSWQVEGSLRRLASPSTPDYPLDNTGVDEWNAGATAGYQLDDAEYTASYRHHAARLGVCSCLQVDSLEDFYAQLEREEPLGADLYRSDFEIERPYQAVAHDLAIARGKWRRPGLGTVTATYAFQFDHRAEYDVVRDATTGPQYDFFLRTHDLDVAVEQRSLHLTDHLHLKGGAGVLGMVQTHDYGGLTLVPDHDAWGAGVYAIERLVGHDFEVEAGLRYDVLSRRASIVDNDYTRLVRSGQLDDDACPEAGDFHTCASTFHTVSASLGALRQLSHAWSIKGDVSTASRPPNPDEQYLNGASPTFPVLGLGKPDLGAETTYAASATTTYAGERVAAEASVFANRIDDYIYFAPAIDVDGEPVFDVTIRGTFPRFVTRPVDAVFYGADGGVTVKPTRWLELDASVSLVRARNVTDDGYLVFVPSDRARGGARYTTSAGRFHDVFVSTAATVVARQKRFDRDADLAPPPDGYVVVDAAIGAATRVGDDTLKLALEGSNLLDARYRDYTSLLRYFADQPGYQVLLRLSLQLGKDPS